MNRTNQSYSEAFESKLQGIPVEYMPALLKIVDAFRETVSQKDLEISIQRSFEDAQSGKTFPVSTLWDAMDD